MTAKSTQTPVVILRSGHHGGLGIARSLGRLGVHVYCVGDCNWEPAFSSRYCRGRFVGDTEASSPAQSVAALLQIGRNLGGRPIIIPTTDRGAIWVAENATALRTVFHFPYLDPILARVLCDKGRMQELASRNGVPIAQSVVPRSKDDVARFLDSATFPVMVKATDDLRLRSRVGATKFIIHSRHDLFELYARAEDREEPNLLIQEFIPGEDWMFDGYFDENSRCLFGATGTKIRRFPVNTGVTSLGVCRRNEAVERTTAEFMQAIGYQGILDIGYRYDLRDRRYKVLDVNPRIGCTFRLFSAADGMDVARALYRHLTGQQVVGAPVPEGRKWIVEDFDLISAFRSWRTGTLTFMDWLRSFRGIQEAACFAFDDPLPFLMMPLADCSELYNWFRRHRNATKRVAPASEEISGVT